MKNTRLNLQAREPDFRRQNLTSTDLPRTEINNYKKHNVHRPVTITYGIQMI